MTAKLFEVCISEFVIDRDGCSDFVDYIFAMPFRTNVPSFILKTSSKT